MKWNLRILGLIAAAATVSTGIAVALEAPPGDPDVVEILSGMSYIPDRASLDALMGATAVENLIEIAEDTSVNADPGLKIRALRSLGEYNPSPSRTLAAESLRRVITIYRSEIGGTELLYLRTSMLALAKLEGPNAVSNLLELINHPSRDIRAGCAQALGITNSAAAISALRDRALIEEQAQVQLAIADALFRLGSPQ